MDKSKIFAWGYVGASIVTVVASVPIVFLSAQMFLDGLSQMMRGNVITMIFCSSFLVIGFVFPWAAVEIFLMAGIGNRSGRLGPSSARSRFHILSMTLIIMSSIMAIVYAHPVIYRSPPAAHHPVGDLSF